MSKSLTDLQNWDRIADTYVQMTGTLDNRIYQQFKDVLWNSLGDVRGKEILDLGCGHGRLSKSLVDADARVWGGLMALLNC